MTRPTPTIAIVLAALCLAAAFISGCGDRARPRAQTVDIPRRDVHPSLRGTIGAQASLTGDAAVLASGIGLVVGLNGTGGQILSEQVFASLERELSLRGIGAPGEYRGTLFEGRSPREVLQDENVAAVLVQAAIPPGSRAGDRVDVFVRALNATSLDGGRLFSTELRLGDAVTFGGGQARILGRARGDIFINPFAEGEAENLGVNRTVGRVLNGAEISEDILIRVNPDNPSHTFARLIVSAINSRFPRDNNARLETAIGRGSGRAEVGSTPSFEGDVQVRIPDRYADRPDHFVELLRFLQVDTTQPQVYARRYVTTLVNEPQLGDEMALCLEAIGDKALPFIRDLYEFEETVPRLKALQAGANLGDPVAVPHLIEIAQSDSAVLQIQAINLLGRMESRRGLDPRADTALAEILSTDALNVRIAAYEALATRAETAQRRRLRLLSDESRRRNAGLRDDQIDLIASTNLPMGTLQRVSRIPIGQKFLLDRVPSGEPLVYVTQQGIPRIVLFGRELTLERPALVTALGGRFTMVSDSPTDPHRVLYRRPAPNPDDPDTFITERVGENITQFIDFLAHSPTSGVDGASITPGLDLTYSQIVGVLYDAWQAGATNAAFATENDRLFADLSTTVDIDPIIRRPLSPEDRREVILFDESDVRPIDRDETGDGPGDGTETGPVDPRPRPGEPGSLLEPIIGAGGEDGGGRGR